MQAKADVEPALRHAMNERNADDGLRYLALLGQAGADVAVGFFLLSAKTGNASTIEHFIRKGVDVGASLVDGQTALHYAAVHGHVSVARRLLSAGADPNVTDVRGRTPLQIGALFMPHLLRVAQ